MITKIKNDKENSRLVYDETNVMVLKNYSQNKWNSDSNVSKNTSKPCASIFSECQVKNLIQKYEHLSAKNNDFLSGVKHCSSVQYICRTNSEMLGDIPINLNKNHVYRFLSLDNDDSNKCVFNERQKNELSNSYSDSNVKTCDKKMPSHSKKASKLKTYEVDKERKHDQSKSPTSPKRKEDIWKIFTYCNDPNKNKRYDNRNDETKKDRYKYTPESDKDKNQVYSYSLPSGKKKETSFGKQFIRSFSATTTRDNKLKNKSLSNNQCHSDNKVKTLPKDGSSIVKTRIETYCSPENTGAIKKQLSSDDVTYRRRPSYLMATQNYDSFRKLKIYPDKVESDPKQSYVSKTISKFENDIMTMVDMTTKKSHKLEHEIKQLFQQYHDNKKFGTSNKMTREELSLEIDNVLLNKFKQISSDKLQETTMETSGAENHNNLNCSTPNTTEQDETITVVIQQPEETITKCSETDKPSIQTDYVIIAYDSEKPNGNISQGHALNLESTDGSESELNVREKLSAELNKMLSVENLQGSVENLCDGIAKDLDLINKRLSEIDFEIKDISVVHEENMIENNNEQIYENLQFIQDRIHQSKENNTSIDNSELVLRDSGETKPKRKVSNLVNYFSDIIKEISSDRSSTLDNRKSTSSNRTIVNEPKNYNDDVFESPTNQNREEFRYSTVSTPEYSQNYQKNPFNTTFSSESSSSNSIYEKNFDKLEEISILSIVNSPTIKITSIEDKNLEESQLSFSDSNHEAYSICQTPQRSSLYSSNSFRTNASSEENFEYTQYKNGNIRSIRTLPVEEQTELLRNELKHKTSIKRHSSLKIQSQQKQESLEQVQEEIKPRLSRLYSGKFTHNHKENVVKQDTNNNECTITQTGNDEPDSIHITPLQNEELYVANKDTGNDDNLEIIRPNLLEENLRSDENIYDTIKTDHSETTILPDHTIESNDDIDQRIFNKIDDDNLFFSDSEGDYDLTETYNIDNAEFISLQRKISTNEWVEKSIKRIEKFRKETCDDVDENEDTEHIYEQLRTSGSTGTLCTIYDEQNNPTIRMSMLDISGDYVITEKTPDDEKNEDSEKEMKIEESVKEIRKNIEEIQDNSKKACLINELITTEKNYINISLHRLVHDYMPEMDKEDIPKGLFGKSRQIFGNADMIYEGHKKNVLPDLEKHTSIEDLANCFLKHETIFKLYPLYSKNKPKSDVVLRDYNFFFKAKQDALNDKLDLASYLLTPIQRLAKYCLLVKSLVKECEKENIECEKLKSALEMLNKQMRMGNDLIALDSIVNYDGDIREHGEVLLRDTFMVTPPNKKPPYEGMIFLFQECLIITAVNRQDFQETFVYKDSFQLTDMGYTPEIDTGSLEFSVWFRKHDIKMYRFRTKSYELKEKWVKEIFSLLWKQLEANKRRRKKELEENGVKETRVPVHRPYSVPNKGKPSSRSSSTKSTRKRVINSSADTIWYTMANT